MLFRSQYYLKSTGAVIAGAGTSTVTKAVGESETVGDVVVKVKDIAETVGACTAAGGACTVDKTALKATLDNGETSKDMWVPYDMKATDRLVISDAETPTAQNLILVGGPVVNTVTASALSGTDVKIDKPGVYISTEIGKTGKIVVAGYTAQDTQDAAAKFIADLLAKA